MWKQMGLALISFTILSCSPDQESPQAVPTTPEAIQKAQDDVLGTRHPQEILAGEFVYTITTQHVFSSQEPSESLLEEEAMTITEKIDWGDYIEFTAVREKIDHTQPDSPKYKFKDILYVAKKLETTSEAPVDLLVWPPQTLSPLRANFPLTITHAPLSSSLTAQDTDSTESTKVEYFNLKVSPEKISKPRKVLERDPCQESSPCDIAIQKITYDLRVTLPNETPRITSIELWLSDEVPYLAAVLKSCFKTVISIEGARPLIQQCTTVMDYKFQ